MLLTNITKPLDHFAQAKFQGLDQETISPFKEAFKQTQKVMRFVNDENVPASKTLPSLYDHIFKGLELARDEIFNGIEDAKGIVEEFNKAYLVHDFGEMFMEFSTYSMRYKGITYAARHELERNIAEFVFTIAKESEYLFQNWFDLANKILKTLPEHEDRVEAVKEFFARLNKTYKKWFCNQEAILKPRIQDFKDKWLEYFDLSQDPEKLKTSFVANLVKVVDKLEGQRASNKIHDPSIIPTDFAKDKIRNYLKPFHQLRDCQEAQNLTEASPEAQILTNLDTIIRQQFTDDNARIAQDQFENFDQAYETSLELAV